jgi:hypothetical protein
VRRFVTALAIALALIGAGTNLATATTVTTAPSTTQAIAVGNPPSVIPLPNSGQEPKASGDRGGWAQLTLFAVMVGGLCLIGGRITWSARRARRG